MKKNKKYKALVVFSTILAIVYFIWRIFFTMPFAYGKTAIIFAVIFLMCELVSSAEAFINIVTSLDKEITEKPDIPKEWYPDVDVFIATHNESTDILYKTVNGCKHMDYPDKSKVHIWICDDGNRKEMKELAEKMNVGYQGLANNTLAKAGNLNNAISKTNSPLIVTFDSDMIPRREFLMETVPFFFLPKMKKDESGNWVERKSHEIDSKFKIGFVQTPQCFYNPDLFQYNLYSEQRIPNEQDYFFREINVKRNSSNSPIYAGSNTVISREALLEVGGIATGTITEDFETGLHIQEKGYTCYAIDKDLAYGLSPDTIESLIKQRERWGRGCIFSLRRIKIFSNKHLSFKAKLSYFSCELYWWTFLRRFVFIVSPIIFAIFSVPVLVCKPWQLLAIWLPYYYLMNKCQKYISSDIRIQRWSDIIDTAMFPYLIIPIVMEALGIKKRQFVVTRKDRQLAIKSTAVFAVPHIILLISSVFAFVISLSDLVKYKAFGSIIILYWMFKNSIALIMSIFFMIGRKNYRMSERYNTDLSVKITSTNNVICTKTMNISETGLAVTVDSPIFIDKDEEVHIQINTDYWYSEFNGKLVYVSRIEDEMKWKYSFKITSISESNRREYYQIVYDRRPSLASKINKNSSIFEDLLLNITGRSSINKRKEEFRQAYRIPVNDYLQTDKGEKIYTENFNYNYIVFKHKDDYKDLVTIVLENGLKLKCEYVKHINEKEKMLYRVLNVNEICAKNQIKPVIEKWLNKDQLIK